MNNPTQSRTALETRLLGVLVAFSTSVLVVVLLGATVWKLSADSLEAANNVARTLEVLLTLSDVESELRRAESSVRGYAITGEHSYKAEHDEARSSLENTLRQVKTLTADNARQQKRWLELRAEADARLALMERTALARASAGFEAARAIMVASQTREAMQRVLRTLREMEREERDLLKDRESEQGRLRTIAVSGGALAALLLIVLLAATYVLISRQAREAAHSERLDQTQRAALTLFNSTFNRQPLLEGVLAVLAEDQPYQAGAFYGYDEWTGLYSREAARGARDGAPREFRQGEGAIGQAAQDGKLAVLAPEDAAAWRIEAGLLGVAPAALALVPVRYQDKPLGVFALAATRRLATRDLEFLGQIGQQLGIALNNLRQFADQKLLAGQLRRRGEEIAEKNRQLDEASRAKSEFLANMSHELRTPMNAIIGFSETLKDGLLGELGAEQKSPVEDIFSSATHLLSLINDILDLSKVEAGKMALELEPVKPRGLLEASLVIVREKAMSSGIKLALEVPAPLPDIALDPRRVKQILFNLLSNGVKFTGEGGAVTLTARRAGRAEVRGQLAPEDRPFAEFLEIAVRDTGVGMTREELGSLFQPFVQIDSSLTRKHEGTGLGLAMVKQLASLHGGAVWVESEPGKGSTFTVWLPWRTAQAQEAPAPGMAQPRSLRVLVVEDDPKAVALLRGELEREGLAVEVAVTGAAALAIARADPPDLVTLDLLLPDMDGWDVLARLKEEPRLAQVPVLILSVVADEKRGIAMGALRVLQKPVPHGELIAALGELGLIEARAGSIPSEPPLVLVIDDEPKAVEILALYLESANCRVERAYGGAEGLAAARARLPGLVILDLMMPEMSGFEVAAALKADAGTAAIPIIVVTAKLPSAEDRRQLHAQVVKVIEKGQFGRDAFVAEVRRALAGRRKPGA